jgi:type II secretory pathway pseudopilin PulG
VTLIETLASLALVAVVAPILAKAWTVTMDSAARSRDQVTASVLAENTLTEMVAEGDLTSADQRGSFGDEHPGFAWETSITDWPQDSRFKEVDVTVTWARRQTNYRTTVTTIVSAAAAGSTATGSTAGAAGTGAGGTGR